MVSCKLRHFVCMVGVLSEWVEMHNRDVMVLRLCAYLVDRGVFEVNELYEYGRLVSVVLGNFILTFWYILYILLINIILFFFRMCQSLHY